MESELLITVDAAPASDSWGFIGRVLIGDLEAYRTIRAYASPTEAAEATSHLLAGVLGPLLAGQEWNSASDEFGHPPLRTELEFGLKGRRARPGRQSPPQDDPATSG